MNDPQRVFAIVVLASLGASSVPFAQCPSDSDIPCGINLVGVSGGVVDPRGEFTIVIRDLAHNPIPDIEVAIDFSPCTPDIRLAAIQPWPGISIDCTPPTGIIRAVTDANGRVDLRIVGGANNTASGTPGAGFKCATVYAAGFNCGQINVGVFDQNGGSGVNPADVSVWLPDSFDGDFEGRSDFNCTNNVNPADLAILLGASLGSGSLQSAASFCH